MKKILLLSLLVFLSTSCVSKKNLAIRQNILTLRDSYCKAPFHYNYDEKLPSYNSDSILLTNSNLKANFSDQSILMLNALGNLDEVNEIIDQKKKQDLSAQVKVLQLKMKINSKITLALSELDAVAAEFDCEGERVEQVEGYVDNLNDVRNKRLILFSVITGAAASIAGGIVTNDGWSRVIDVSGGGLGAAFGLATLDPKGKKVEFIHKRNLLSDIWNEKLTSTNFPPFIWYMYTEPRFSRDNVAAIESIKAGWLHYQFDDDQKRADSSVIFSDGGMYFSKDLQIRAAMLNQMQSATRTINQTINYLLLDLDKLIL
ncbi:hypothetical protein ASG01_12465 [Chryseobacterium sp. Leaf180]|uniref:hypothetical protein n=1 Tax=Chryseobacterium sp. Leaf180 TaxID=1736289 RepID=UPI0006FF8A0E|nr:hypothetical protein [Chryseobacterium sp. Leaf180]KQR92698.1 hypothetical protein ASG01_12465 [Chryseobacterium sp. Leaf180]